MGGRDVKITLGEGFDCDDFVKKKPREIIQTPIYLNSKCDVCISLGWNRDETRRRDTL